MTRNTNRDFENCRKNRRIVKQLHAEELIPGELEAALSDLASANNSLDRGDYKWATIQAYYCIFHASRALLFAQGYREKSHFCLKAAIQSLYVDRGILDQECVDDFDATMLLRETADYGSSFSHEGAQAAMESARRFVEKAKQLLE
ncbi:MAG: HEPN domain-containing protein [Deltaproteobacteria bacterium]|nr:HEPN domain-containing protein [Deltaproteobacteria bacterium]